MKVHKADLSFVQSFESRWWIGLLHVFIYLRRKHHFSGLKISKKGGSAHEIRELWHKLSVKTPSMGWKNGKAGADRIRRGCLSCYSAG